MSHESSHLATRCVHAGELDDPHGSPHTPLYHSTTFKFASTADIVDVVQGRRSAALYTRYGLNPTIRSLEDKLAALEGAQAALAFCSGMAAESALFLTHGRKGIVCLGDAYGGTLELLASQLPQLGIPTHLLLSHELGRLDEILAKGVGLVFFETPTNPGLEIFDIHAVAKLAHAYGALVAVDNTFASPVNQQPLALGADLVVHSATKYLGGHSDLTAGAIMGRQELLLPIWNWRKNLGQTIAPEIAALLARSIRTLPVRVHAQNASAQAVAEAMAKHPKVARVLYPGLPDFAGHALAKRQMSGFGGMLTFVIRGGLPAARAFLSSLRIFALAESLGGVESLIEHPAIMTHASVPPETRASLGIDDGFIRVSVGIESADDLIADLEGGFAAARAQAR